MAGDAKTWADKLKGVPLTGTISLLARDEGQVPPVGTHVSFLFEEGTVVGLRDDPKGEWQITRRESVDLAGTPAIGIVITRVAIRGQGPA